MSIDCRLGGKNDCTHAVVNLRKSGDNQRLTIVSASWRYLTHLRHISVVNGSTCAHRMRQARSTPMRSVLVYDGEGMKTALAIQTFLLGSASVMLIIALFIFFSSTNLLLAGDDTSIGLVLSPGIFLAFWILGVSWRTAVFVSLLRRSHITRALFTADMVLGIWNMFLPLFLFRERTFFVTPYLLIFCAAFGALILKSVCLGAYRRSGQ